MDTLATTDQRATQALEPAVFLEYTDPLEGFKGWLVIDGVNHPLAAGGLRVQKSLTGEHLKKMARNMTKKMRVWGLPINGAKSGLAYDPASPGKDEAIRRFMQAIKPYMAERYSMGGDLNTTMPRLDEIAQSLGVSSIKIAVAKAQGMALPYFEERYSILDQPAIGDWSLGKLRAGYGVGMAGLALLDYLGIVPGTATAAVQGFGTLAKASIVGLRQAGVRIVAIADATQCIVASGDRELDLDALLATAGTLLPNAAERAGYTVLSSEAIISVEADVLMLEAIENAVTGENSAQVRARGVVPGANLAVSTEAQRQLHKRGVPVLPCFVAGSGGTVAMNGLFGPDEHPSPAQVLDYVQQAMSEMIGRILHYSEIQGLTPTEIAEHMVAEEPPVQRTRPYAI